MHKKFIAAAMAVFIPFAGCERGSVQRIKQAELCMHDRAYLAPDVNIKIEGELDAPQVTLSSAIGLERLPSVKQEWNKSQFKTNERIYSFDQEGNFMVDGIRSYNLWEPARKQGEYIFNCIVTFDKMKKDTALAYGPAG